jgi:hypothetical protein
LCITTDAATGEDSSEIEFSTEVTPGQVEIVSDAFALEIGVDIYIGSIKCIPLWVVIVKEASISDSRVGMWAIRIVAEMDDETGDCPDDLPIDFRDDLALWKVLYMACDVCGHPDDVFFGQSGEAEFIELNKTIDVGFDSLSQRDCPNAHVERMVWRMGESK